MVKQPEVLALIPARGGSKGIPGKNIKSFAGYPLIAYSIWASLESERVNRVVVSTDDEKIAAIARDWGAETPFMRPEEYAQDRTLDLPVLKHALDWLRENEDYHPEIVVWMRPTSPIRPPDCVDEAVKKLLAHPEADCVRGVVQAGQNPFKMWTIDDQSGAMQPLVSVEGIDEPYNAPRQSLPSVYWQTGHIDALWTKNVYEKNSMTGDVLYPLFIDPSYTVDIDLPVDWKRAEDRFLSLPVDKVDPASFRRSFPDRIRLMVLDFDGVLTDDRVWVHENGEEMVAASRSDGMGLEKLRQETDIEVMVLSRESNPVVTARCKKLGIPVWQSVLKKAQAIREVMAEKKIKPNEVLYVGNDINDLEVFPEVGFAVAPADAQGEVLRRADLVLTRRGGKGAIRELCDMIVTRQKVAK